MTEKCLVCELNKDNSNAPGGTIKTYTFWILQHIIEPIPIRGWLVLKTKRHVEGITDIENQEANELGTILAKLPKVQKEVLGASKIYVCCFTEEVSHLHIHFIPRYQNDTIKGPQVFETLRKAKAGEIKAVDREECIKIAADLQAKL